MLDIVKKRLVSEKLFKIKSSQPIKAGSFFFRAFGARVASKMLLFH
jgi:hypothetical protein